MFGPNSVDGKHSMIDLNEGAISTIDGQSILLSAGSVIENVFSGDGNDQLIGNTLNNTLMGGRGDDLLIGGIGDDILFGGSGSDTAYFSDVHLNYSVTYNGDGSYSVTDGDDIDFLNGIEWLQFDDGTYGIDEFPGDGNHSPTPIDQTVETTNRGGSSGSLTASDLDGDLIEYTLISGPVKGILTLNPDGSYTYDPSQDFGDLAYGETTTETFEYSLSDGKSIQSVTGTIEVTGTNNVPRATVYYFGAQENSIVSGAFESSDVDGDSVTYELLEGPSTGTLTLNEDGSYLYDAGAYQNYTAEGNVTQINFTYRIKDSYGGYIDQRGFVLYEGTNDTPVIYNADIMRSASEETVLMENTNSHDIDEADRYEQLHELSNGNFLFVYSDGYAEPYAEVRFKIVSATGEIIAPDQRVDTNDVDWQRSPDTLVMSDGSFWVYWSLDSASPFEYNSYVGRHYDANGTALSGEIELVSGLVNAFSANAVETASGNILFTWVCFPSTLLGPNI